MASLHWLDVFILGIFLLISIGIGVYHALTGGRQRTTAEFIMANRKLQVIPTVISMMVSHQSAIMILGIVVEMYRYILNTLNFWLNSECKRRKTSSTKRVDSTNQNRLALLVTFSMLACRGKGW